MRRARAKNKRIRKEILAARQGLLRIHTNTARFNASIRRPFPQSHRLTKSMERNTSGLINDAPAEVQSFVASAEDACYAHCPEEEAAFGEDVGVTIDEARRWAGRPAINPYGIFNLLGRCPTWT